MIVIALVTKHPSLSVSVDLSRPIDDKNHYASSGLVHFFKSPGANDSTACTFTPNWTTGQINYEVNCGLHLTPIRIHQVNDGPMVMDFVLKSQKGNFSEILIRPDSSETVWIKESSEEGVLLQVTPIAAWLTEDEYITFIKGDLLSHSLYSEPKDSASISTTCTQANIRPGQETKGDWIKVYCELPDCFSPVAYGVVCEPAEIAARKEQEKAESVCKSGWTRWLGLDGHPILEPESGPGCD